MNFLEFDYLNHKGNKHHYVVIPLSVEFGDNKLNYLGQRESWNLKAFVLERDGERRNVIRTFCIMKMQNIAERILVNETR